MLSKRLGVPMTAKQDDLDPLLVELIKAMARDAAREDFEREKVAAEQLKARPSTGE